MAQAAGKSTSDLTPDDFMQMGMAYSTPRILSIAVRLNFFSQIAAGRATVGEVARAAGTSERGTRMLLDALTALQLLTKTQGRYGLTSSSAKYLVRENPDYIGAIMEDDTLWETWGKLEEAVRTGKPPRTVERQAAAERFFPVLIRSLHILNREPARRAASALGVGSSRHGLRILDIACGSGVWGIAAAEVDPNSSLTMQDFPGVLEHTREYIKRHGLANRTDYLPGDLKRVDFSKDRYDVALLGNIVHSEGEGSSRNLFGRLFQALRPKGQLAIIDLIPNEDRSGPPRALIFAVNMLVNTETGDTYTLAEYTDWLKQAGFQRVETADIESHSPMIVATKE